MAKNIDIRSRLGMEPENKELISITGETLSTKKELKFKNQVPKVRGNNILIKEDAMELDNRTASGLITSVENTRKKYFLVEDFGDGVDQTSLPFKKGDYVEVFSDKYTYFTALDGKFYSIVPTDQVVGYYEIDLSEGN